MIHLCDVDFPMMMMMTTTMTIVVHLGVVLEKSLLLLDPSLASLDQMPCLFFCFVSCTVRLSLLFVAVAVV
jgi:hypothetical protein